MNDSFRYTKYLSTFSFLRHMELGKTKIKRENLNTKYIDSNSFDLQAFLCRLHCRFIKNSETDFSFPLYFIAIQEARK